MSDGLDRKTIEPGNSCGGYSVYGHGTYQRSSVLAGRPKRVFLDNFRTVEEAQAAYPDAEVIDGSSRVEGYNAGDLLPQSPPSWFDPTYAGEVWHEDDY